MFTNERLFTIQAFTITRVHCTYVELEKNVPGWSSIFSSICWESSMTQTRFLFSGNGYNSISRLILTGSPTLWGRLFFYAGKKLQWNFCIVMMANMAIPVMESQVRGYKIWNFSISYNGMMHGLRTPNEGINQRNLKILADVADKICFGRT